jgi:putative pyruvate formate lyase activating enzyme
MMWRYRRPTSDRLDNLGVKKSLPRYIEIIRGKKSPKYLISQSLPADFSERSEIEKLWKIHDLLLEQLFDYQEIKKKPLKKAEKNFLDLKILIASRLMQNCTFCHRSCCIDRQKGEKGYCGASREFTVYSAFPHMGEEPELIPSGTIFTGGCSIRCIHCQNWDISQLNGSGTGVNPEMMAHLVSELADKGCLNINMVGGDPTPYVWHWLESMRKVKKSIATIWNSNSYYSLETAKLLAGFIDVYLLDFKYGNNKCATEISDAPEYWEICTRNHLWAKKYGELIIRVLVLPEHNECCTRPILQWIHDNNGPWARVNLMFQYRPEWRARERPELSRRLTKHEISEAKQIAKEVGLKNLVRE